ncbi:hypothetical protein HMPREF1544_00190 [Mucor circinelloides 1006PhL]|uniref:Tc1-like transposase DDE domain-containing protein n=1 Tax=Mucor circinelloides f. circinelloides (strain 1006PhL) TaxID=1220926 RepID=S2JSB8_MUCC1|nr:hypothetical protein HMPREF1544_00190 [Mucor circinelloides 1006PhL]
MKGHYIVMDNALIYTHENIKKYIEYRGYRCVYLPTCSPELNPIEQFWAIAKSKVKRLHFAEDAITFLPRWPAQSPGYDQVEALNQAEVAHN